MDIRLATEKDADSISKLSIEAVLPNGSEDFNEEGWKLFLSFTNVSATRKRLLDENHFTLYCREENKISGMITIFENEKIYQLFVLSQARNKGVARELWNQAERICLDRGNPGDFWVRSSTLAIPIYQKFGFIKEGEREVVNGIRSQVMRKSATF